MRVKHTLRGLTFAGAVALVVLAPTWSASAAVQRDHHQAKPVTTPGPAHWSGPNGTFGNWGHVPARARSPHAPLVDNLTNPWNNEIMPTTDTYAHLLAPVRLSTTAAARPLRRDRLREHDHQVLPGRRAARRSSTRRRSTPGTTAVPATRRLRRLDRRHDRVPERRGRGDAVTQSDLNSEIFDQITVNSWPLGLSDMYFVFLPNNLVDCNNAGTNCNTNTYCAYHTAAGRIGHAGQRLHLGRHPGQPQRLHDPAAAETRTSPATSRPTRRSARSSTSTWRRSPTRDRTPGRTRPAARRERRQVQPQHGRRQRILDDAEQLPRCGQRATSSASSVSGRTRAGGGGCAASYTTTGSFVESPVPTGGDVTNTVTESTIAGQQRRPAALPRSRSTIRRTRTTLSRSRSPTRSRPGIRARRRQPRRPRAAPDRERATSPATLTGGRCSPAPC